MPFHRSITVLASLGIYDVEETTAERFADVADSKLTDLSRFPFLGGGSFKIGVICELSGMLVSRQSCASYGIARLPGRYH
jgi:hypothetical protein